MKTELDWKDLWQKLGMIKDNGGRFYPGDNTPNSIREYLKGYRVPSRKWPYSYAKPLLTKKFAKWLINNDQSTAKNCGLI